MGLIIPWRWPGRPTNDDAEDEQESEHADHAVLDEAAEDRADIGSAARLFGCGQERDQVRDLASRFHEAGCPAGGQESRKCL
ncbi:hypothetical protein [Streptomyces prasinosporus]|uniref:hypothetical protein n=1 Tax=Streptomyces prasinosporus TaxID=68256 RepID=UPI001874EC91